MTWRPVPFAEDCPRVPIRVLKKAGLLQDTGGKLVLRTADLDVLVVAMDASSALFAWKDEDQSHRQWVEISFNYLRFGERPVFVCPLTGANCYDLYLDRGRWGSANGHGLSRAARNGNRHGRRRAKLETINAKLEGLEGFPKARGLRRARLVAEALKVPFATTIESDLGSAAAAEERKRQRSAARRVRSSRKRGPLSTEAALLGGCDNPYSGVGANNPKSLLAIVQAAKAPELNGRALASRPLMKLESCAVLDARTLRTIWAEKPITLTTLAWPSGMETATQFVIVTDLSERATPTAGVCRISADAPRFQSLRLERASIYKPGNWVFICPVLGTRHDVLFLRDGFFASAKAQRLVHASQRR